MQLECELCGAHYKADIADAHVDGGRLTFTCKSCGQEVVVVGGRNDPARRAGALVPDQPDDPFDTALEPAGADEAFPAAEERPEASSAPAPDPFPESSAPGAAPPVEGPGGGAVAARPLPGEVPAPTSAPRPAAAAVPEPAFSAVEKKSSGLLFVAAGMVVVFVGGGIFFLGPMLTGKKDERPVEPAALPARPAAPPPAAAPTALPTALPTPEQAPVVQVRELKAPEAKPTAVPTPKKESVRDARSVFEAGAIEEALIRARPLYRLCAVGETKRNPDSKLGTVVATMTIAPSGAVTKVVLDRPDLASSPLGQCVRDALGKLAFPAFDGAPAVLRQTIDLEVQTAR